MEKMKIRIPDLKTQKDMADRISNLEKSNKVLEDEIRLKLKNLKSLKSSLLDQAFKGEL